MNKSVLQSINEDNGNLVFTYDNGKKEDYSIQDNGEGERYIANPDYIAEPQKAYFLIENDDQIITRKQQGDFKRCIFLTQVIFRSSVFNERTYFLGAIFSQEVYFEGATFSKQVDFGGAAFTEQANFEGVTFIERADFGRATFTEQADFLSATFTEQANFWRATFTERANFGRAIFTERANFEHATFTKQADFRGATFSQHLIDFQQAQFSTSLILNSVKSIHLNLNQTQLDTIYYDTNTTFNAFNDIPSRDTFLILKSVALKQHDKIKALEFHTQEYEQHWDKLNWSTNFGDKLILGFEKWASYFGTSVSRSVSRYFGFAGVFYLLMNGFNNDAQTVANFIIPIKIAVNDLLLSNCPMPWDYGLFVFYKIGQIILLYEIIKSFRKYSRSL